VITVLYIDYIPLRGWYWSLTV